MQTNEFIFYELIIQRDGTSKSLYTFQKPDEANGQMTVSPHTGILPAGLSVREAGGRRFLCEEICGASAETDIAKIVSRDGDALLLTQDGREVRACLPYEEFRKQYTRRVEESFSGPEEGAIFWTRDAAEGSGKELVMQDMEGEEKVLANLDHVYKAYTDGASVKELAERLKETKEITAADRPAGSDNKDTGPATYTGSLPAWEDLRKDLYIDTVCVTKNRELLKAVPCRIKGDFAAVLVLGTESGFTKPLTNEHLAQVGQHPDHVFAKAIENTRQHFPIPKVFFSVYQTEVYDGVGDPYDTKYKKNQFYRKVRIIQDLSAKHGHAVLFYPEFEDTLKRTSGTMMYLIQDKDSYIAVPRKLEITGYDSAREWCEEFISENNSDPSCPLSTRVHEFDPVAQVLLCNGKETVEQEEKKPERRTLRRTFHMER